MGEKIAYLFFERRPDFPWFGTYVKEYGAALMSSLDETVRRLRDLRNKGYQIVDRDVPLSTLGFPTTKYRDMNDRERRALTEKEEELVFHEKYPGLFNPEELAKLEKYRGKVGRLWVSDVALMDQKELVMIRNEMGSGYISTTYYLALGREQVRGQMGRIDPSQYADLLKQAAAFVSLHNATPEQAKSYREMGRPLNTSELEFIVGKGITLV
ncbi:MAG: hypothetical protein V2A62_02730 [Candidatus Woesearchaeota archaeon]